MKKILYFVIFMVALAIFVFVGLNYKMDFGRNNQDAVPSSIKEPPVQENNSETSEPSGGQSGMANPASVYCVEQGGKLEIKDGEGGQYGVCVMPDGAQCDEWDFFRTKRCGAGVGGQATGSQTCVVENCHGLDIKCGANAPEVCTEIYQLGDNCRQFAKCGIVDGVCQQIKDAQFDECKKCIDGCGAQYKNDAMKAFDCGGKCLPEK